MISVRVGPDGKTSFVKGFNVVHLTVDHLKLIPLEKITSTIVSCAPPKCFAVEFDDERYKGRNNFEALADGISTNNFLAIVSMKPDTLIIYTRNRQVELIVTDENIENTKHVLSWHIVEFLKEKLMCQLGGVSEDFLFDLPLALIPFDLL